MRLPRKIRLPPSLPFMGREDREAIRVGMSDATPALEVIHTSPPWPLRGRSLPMKGREAVARSVLAFLGVSLTLLLAACSTDHARPLATAPNLVPDASRLSVDVSRLRLGPLKAHPFDPARGLDPTDVAVLAVLNSPDLTARRAAARVAGAQAFAAGLLPDPQLGVTWDIPVVRGPGITNAYNLNPNLDLIALITHSTALKAARATANQADLDLLWAEWSTAQKARTLAVTIMADEAKAQTLRAMAEELSGRYEQSQKALERGDASNAQASADLAARIDAETQLAAAVHDAAKARGDLDALIGLSPTVVLTLVPGDGAVDPNTAGLDAALAALTGRRPDLLALKAGYGAQDANVRKSILTQFPLLNLGFSRQSDATDVITNGVSATFVIPLFNRGHGDIAVQTATREQLAAEYQARLDQTVADVAAARRDREEARAILARLETEAPHLAALADNARGALARGDIDSAAFLALDQAALKERVALFDQRLAVTLADISLETVLFLPSDQGSAQ